MKQTVLYEAQTYGKNILPKNNFYYIALNFIFLACEELKELRCMSCSRILAKASVQTGKIEIKCRCGVTNTFSAKQQTKPEGQVRRPVFQMDKPEPQS